MDFLGKMGDAISTGGKAVADKAKVLAGTAALKSQISACEEVMKKNYMEIGKLYYEKYSDAPEASFEKRCQAITNARSGIYDIQEKINALKDS